MCNAIEWQNGTRGTGWSSPENNEKRYPKWMLEHQCGRSEHLGGIGIFFIISGSNNKPKKKIKNLTDPFAEPDR